MSKLNKSGKDDLLPCRYLDFDEILDEHRHFYNDYSNFKTYSEVDKENFLRQNIIVFSKYLDLSSAANYFYSENMKIQYTLLGISYEYLLKICVLKIDWNRYLEEYENNTKKRKFEEVKTIIQKDLKAKLTKKQNKRCRQVFDFVQLQRNHFAHNPFKGMHHYAFTKQVYEVIAVLLVVYKLRIPTEIKDLLLKNIKKHKVSSGMDFEDVNFEPYIAKLNDLTEDIRIDETEW